MITKVRTENRAYELGEPYHNASEYYCLSTDEKPMEGVDNAAALLEMDTGKVFLFDAENRVWLVQKGGTTP